MWTPGAATKSVERQGTRAPGRQITGDQLNTAAAAALGGPGWCHKRRL